MSVASGWYPAVQDLLLSSSSVKQPFIQSGAVGQPQVIHCWKYFFKVDIS